MTFYQCTVYLYTVYGSYLVSPAGIVVDIVYQLFVRSSWCCGHWNNDKNQIISCQLKWRKRHIKHLSKCLVASKTLSVTNVFVFLQLSSQYYVIFYPNGEFQLNDKCVWKFETDVEILNIWNNRSELNFSKLDMFCSSPSSLEFYWCSTVKSIT